MTRSDTRLPAYAWGSEQKVATHPVAQLKQQDNPDEKPLQMTHRSLSPRTHPFHTIYDSAGNIKKMQLGNGRWETSVYNNRQQITQIGLGTTDNTQDLLKLEYGYGTATENNGSLRSQKISFSGLAQPFEQTYTYDDLNRIQQAKEMVGTTETWKQTFTIDRYGNRKFDGVNTTTLGGCSQTVCNPNISTANNRFSSGQGYEYDQNGDVTRDAAGQRFNYDAENHQKEFFAANNSGSTPDASYSYDGDGRRIKKISSTETTVFVYDGGGQLVAEYSTQISQTPQVSYLTQDHLGSPRVTTDQNGAVTSRKDFSAFGDETVTAQRTTGLKYQPDNIRQDYTGYQKDDESGLEFAQARYYNSTHGRYTSVDPLTASASIRNPQTFNRYSYVLNSPYKFVDPLGLIYWESSGACAQWCPGSSNGPGGGGVTGGIEWGGVYYLVTQITTYTAHASRDTRTASFTVTITQQSVQDGFGNTVENGGIRTSESVSVSQPSGNLTAQENSIVMTVAKTAAEIALKKGVDVGEFLGIVQGETEFGIAKSSEPGVPRKDPAINPSQLSGGRAKAAAWGSPGYQSALEYNLATSIDQVYFWAQGQPKSGGHSYLWSTLYYWNNSKKIWNGQTLEERVRFANRVEPIINGIQASKTVHSTRTGSFYSDHIPTSIPLGQVKPCLPLSGC